jgi:uncharacterized repeat protein (TIGR01451 family)
LHAVERGTGANHPGYPGVSDDDLADLSSATVRTRVVTADPAVLVGVDNTTPRVGATVRYTVTATNDGPDTAVGVSVTHTLPAGVRYVSSAATAGVFAAATGAWTGIGDLAVGATRQLTIVARVTRSGSLASRAVITAAAATDGVATSRLRGADGRPDANTDPSNDVDRIVLRTAPTSDARVTKRVSGGRHRVGDVLTYTITASNAGPDAATGVRVLDPLPAGLRFVSARATMGRFARESGWWTIGRLPAHGSATLLVRARVVRPGTIRNTARLVTDNTPGVDAVAEAVIVAGHR